MMIRLSASVSLERNGSNFEKRRSKTVPTNAASVAPEAWPRAASGGTELSATRNALAVIAGQTCVPNANRQATAIPYAGQTGPRLLLRMVVVACPSLPAMKYARNTVVSWTRNADIATVWWLRPFFDDQSVGLEVRELSSVAIGHLARGCRIFAQHYRWRYRICDARFHSFNAAALKTRCGRGNTRRSETEPRSGQTRRRRESL